MTRLTESRKTIREAQWADVLKDALALAQKLRMARAVKALEPALAAG